MVRITESRGNGNLQETPQGAGATDKLRHARIVRCAISCKGLIWQANRFSAALELGGLKCARSWNAGRSEDSTGARKASTYVTSGSASKVSSTGAEAKG